MKKNQNFRWTIIISFVLIFGFEIFNAKAAASVTLTADRTAIITGESTTLTWVSSGGPNNCAWVSPATMPKGFLGSASGSTTVSPSQTTTYYLRCCQTNAAGNACASLIANNIVRIVVTASAPAPSIPTTSLIINLSEFDHVFILATQDYFWISGDEKLTAAEIEDLSSRRKSTTGKTINLSGVGSLSGEKLIDIYNKAKGVAAKVPTVDLKINNSQNPPDVTAPANLTVSWAITNSSQLSNCSSTGQGWDGSKSVSGGSDSGGSLNNISDGKHIYSITCSVTGGGTISDSVTITVKSLSSGVWFSV